MERQLLVVIALTTPALLGAAEEPEQNEEPRENPWVWVVCVLSMMLATVLALIFCRRRKSESTENVGYRKKHDVTTDNDEKSDGTEEEGCRKDDWTKLMGPLSLEEYYPEYTPYPEFDVMLIDVQEVNLYQIGLDEEVEHLSMGTFRDPAFPVRGTVWERFTRFMVPLTCQRFDKPDSPILNVWFLVDTAFPFTCFSVKTLEAFMGAGNVTDRASNGQCYSFTIQDPRYAIWCYVSRVGSHFEHVNILGADSLRKLNL